ncbi:MAG: ribosome maturation factor RimP [Candidatus Methylomirabilia bacterium]
MLRYSEQVGFAHFFVGEEMVTEERLARIEALVSPVLRDHGLCLVDLEWRGAGRRGVLRFYIDRTNSEDQELTTALGGLSIADCQRFSQEVGDLLEVSGLIPESYDLEVSSPGLDRELRKEREFRWAVGKAVRCWLREGVDGRMEVSGRLREVTAESLVLEEAGGRVWELPRLRVTKVRLELPFPNRRARRLGAAG